MKKALVASILGLAAAVNTFAQGVVAFNNYDFNTDARINYGPTGGGTLNAGVNSSFKAGLYYAFGTVAWAGGLADPTTGGFTLAAATATINTGTTASLPGYFVGGSATIPGYSAGPISFVVVAYNGANYAGSGIRGSSVGFTLPGIAVSPTPAGEFGPGLTSFQVNAVPEPSTFALAGLGLASLLIFRRRK